MSRENIRAIQTGLAALGYDIGKAGADGLFGKNTRAAAEAWLAAGGKPAPAVSEKPTDTPSTRTLIRQGSARHPVEEIIVHCAATRPEWMAGRPLADKVAEIRRWHRANGWSDIGYHWIIDRDGAIAPGRAETVVGAHTAGKNSGTIGICLLGGHGSAETDNFGHHYTSAQDEALRGLIASIKLRTAIKRVSGHNEYAAKACPGFNVPLWIKGN